ncbi:phasin [Sphingobium lactosutens]|uniref:phasin family protein n=1 Tax=Sphingobium lactosutens TaxID=522773 RepID=UPI0015BD4BEE|nr:phasin family protein [Sphingobium lactosutens]NWK97210.1 phasin [Sphingobium lactosutens]
MADTPKTPRSTPRSKAGSTTLSASEALKAAEAAIGGDTVKKAPPLKPAPKKVAASSVKPIDTNPQAASVKPIDTNPQAAKVKPIDANPQSQAKPADPVAIVAATTAVDAAPEPEPVAEKPAPEPVPEPVKAEPKITESLTKAETTATQPLPATEGTKIMNDVIETGKKFAEETKAKFETAYSDFNEKTKAHVEKSTKAIEELSDIAKGNVEALVESSKIAAKGIETLGQEAVDYSRKSFEKATASFKTFSSVKTPTEFFQLQSQLFSASFDEFTKEAAKNSEALIKLAGDVAQPLTARVTLVTDKVKSLAA